MHYWTWEDVQKYEKWLQKNHNARIIPPVLETMNGQFLINVAGLTSISAQEAMNRFTKEVINGK